MPSDVLYHLPDGGPNIRAHGSLQDLLAVTPIHFEESHMAKSTTTYWNALGPENRERWTSIKGLEGMAEELTRSYPDSPGPCSAGKATA